MKLLSKGQEIYIITVIVDYLTGGVKKRETEIQAKQEQRRVGLILV